MEKLETGKFTYIVFLYAKSKFMIMIKIFNIKFKLTRLVYKIKMSAILPTRLKHLKKSKENLSHAMLLYFFCFILFNFITNDLLLRHVKV